MLEPEAPSATADAEQSEADHPDIVRLELEGRTIYLLGTAHVSQASVDLVKHTLLELRPDAVAVELCASRHATLRDPERWKNTDLVQVIRQGRGNLLLAQLLLSAFQKRIGQRLGVKPGAEMLQALDFAHELGATTVLADRDVAVTLRRTWRKLGWWSLLKMLGSSVLGLFDGSEVEAADVERMKRSDALEEALRELGDVLPEVKRTLVDERDLYLAARIRRAPGRRIVAVLGAGHLRGVAACLATPDTVDLAELEEVPPPSRGSLILGWLLPLLFLVALVWVVVRGGQGVAWHLFGNWALVIAMSGALGCLLAGAHPLTVVAGFFGAPPAVLHPLVATGWITGLCEAMLRKPRVADFEQLTEEALGPREWWRNRVTRILLVATLPGLTVALGNLLATVWLVRALAS